MIPTTVPSATAEPKGKKRSSVRRTPRHPTRPEQTPGQRPLPPAVAWAVARFEQQDVAGRQADRRDDRGMALAAYPGSGDQHVLQRRQRSLGAMFLEEAQQCVKCVKNDNDADNHGVLDVADNTGQYRRAEQDQHQEAPELVEQLDPGRTWRLFRETVGAGFILSTRAEMLRGLSAEQQQYLSEMLQTVKPNLSAALELDQAQLHVQKFQEVIG